jgi:TPR repeat protein
MDPDDLPNHAKGVDFVNLDVEKALPPCKEAAETPPIDPRYQYQYGRVLSAAKRYSEAFQQYTKAAQAGYMQAMWALRGAYDRGEGVAP